MVEDAKQPEDGAEEQQVPRRRKLKLFLQIAHLVILPILLAVFLLYIVDQQIQPMYGWVAGTPVERVSLALLRNLWRQKSFLERQALNSSLTPEERGQVTAILRKMEMIRPTHALQLKSGERLFGRLSELDEGKVFTIRYFDGQRYQKREIVATDIVFKKRLVIPEAPLGPRDLRFLIAYGDLNHYYLPPYLFAVEGDFGKAFETHNILSELQEEFREAFGSLIVDEGTGHIQVCQFSSHAEFLAQTSDLTDIGMVNSAGYFRKSDNRLMLQEPGAALPGSHHYFTGKTAQVLSRMQQKDEWRRLVRHEGAHQLASAFGVIREHEEIAFWVEEGLAQYCEMAPLAVSHAAKLAVLRQAQKSGRLIPWGELMRMSTAERGKFDESQLQIAYAQSWLLFNHLMDGTYRGHFFKYIVDRQNGDQGGDGGDELIELMNTLKTTREVLERELAARIQQSEEN